MEKKYIQGSIVKASDGNYEFIASDETKDRHGDVIPLDSWDLRHFLNAPRMLVDHWHSVENIVGKWENVRIDKASDRPGLKMTANFHKITELARSTYEMVKQGYLDTVSVGFIPHVDRGVDDNGEEYATQRNELIEVSLVTVPANPNAVQLRSLADEEKKDEEVEQVKAFLDEKEADEPVTPEDGTQAVPETTEPEPIVETPSETHEDTPTPDADKGAVSPKGRSLSHAERQNHVLRGALKEAVKTINFALYQTNKDK